MKRHRELFVRKPEATFEGYAVGFIHIVSDLFKFLGEVVDKHQLKADQIHPIMFLYDPPKS